jgi:membrane fusion protein, multidrug efflux system
MRPSAAVTPHRSTALRMTLMLVLCLIVFGGLFAVQWMGGRMMNEMFDNMAMPPVTVSAAEVRAEIWQEGLEAVGTLVAVNGTHVTTEAAGVVSAIRFDSGEQVDKGEVLLQLDASTELANLRALEAGLRLAVVQRDRFRDLYEGKRLVSQSDLDVRESEAERLQAEVNAQRALIARKTIRAPFAGVLGIRRVNLGQYLSPGGAIVSLQSLDPIYVHFTLPEQRLGQIKVGDPITARVDALAEQSFEGAITALEPEVETRTRAFKVQATLANPDHTLHPGTFARVRAAYGAGTEVIVVPQTAIAFNPYGNAVWVIAGGGAAEGQASPPVEIRPGSHNGAAAAPLTVEQRFVKTGASRGDLRPAQADAERTGDRRRAARPERRGSADARQQLSPAPSGERSS